MFGKRRKFLYQNLWNGKHNKKGNQLLTKKTSAVNSNIFFSFLRCGIAIMLVEYVMKNI
jgi:hypothetical protein